jgi:hypothetical protein
LLAGADDGDGDDADDGGDGGGRVLQQAPKNESVDLPSQGDEQQLVVAELNPKDMTPAENLTLSADRTQVTHRVVCVVCVVKSPLS